MRAQVIVVAVLAALGGPAAARRGGKRVELLHQTDSAVGVSSTVLNGRDPPGHLVDGRLDTAWNSRTGDLVGAWIRFRVPEDAEVEEIRLTAGYAARHGRDDWFLMNPRITQVQVSRGAAAIGRFD